MFRTLTVYTAVGSALVTLTACETLDPIVVKDDNAASIMASVVIEPEALRHRRGQGGIEFGYEQQEGDGTQTIDATHFVNLGGRNVRGPQTVGTRAEYRHGHLAYTHKFFLGPHFQLEPVLGFGLDKTRIAVQPTVPSGASLVTDQDDYWGVYFGVTPRWRFNEYIDAELRVRFNSNFGSDMASTSTPAIVIRPTKYIGLALGYTFFDQELEATNSLSDIEVSLEGPSVALRLAF